MRAVFYERKGPAAEVLTFGNMPGPVPAPSEVRVRVALSAVNPTDVKRRGTGRELGRFPRIIPNNDGAGVIDKVGPGVPANRVGERVWIFGAQQGRPFGTAAEYCCVPARHAVRLPDKISLADGACLGVPAVTAHRCLFADGPIKDEAVLVAGGAGRVGAYAIQLAKRAGAFVVATAGDPGKVASLADLGADVALNYRSDDIAGRIKDATGGKGVVRIVETEFGANVALAPKILAANGTIACYASDKVPEPAVPFYPLMFLNANIRLVYIFEMPPSAQDMAFAEVTAALEEGALKHRIGLRVPFARVADAHEAVEKSAAIGTVMIDVDPQLASR